MVAFTGHSGADDRRGAADIAAMKSASFGRSAMMVTSAEVTSSPPRGTSNIVRSSRRRDEMPANAGSVSGKWRPRSPRFGGAEQRVTQRVGRHVGVGVADQPRRAAISHEAEPERARVDLADAVHVDALSDPHGVLLRGQRPASRSSGSGDLDVARLAGHDDDPSADGLDQRGVVGGVVAPRRARAPARRGGKPGGSGR